MAGRPGVLPWNFATFSGNEPVTTLSDNFNFLNAQINDSGAGWTNKAIDTGTTNNLIVTLDSPPVAYESGMMICVTPANTNTGPSVINVSALGNIPVVNPASIPLNGGEIVKNATLAMVYGGANFRIVGPCPLSISSTGLTANTIFECAGFSSVAIQAAFTSGTNLNVTLAHLSQGVPVYLVIANETGALTAFAVGATNPAGTAFTVVNVLAAGLPGSGGFSNLMSGVGIQNSAAIYFIGSAVSPLTLLFSR